MVINISLLWLLLWPVTFLHSDALPAASIDMMFWQVCSTWTKKRRQVPTLTGRPGCHHVISGSLGSIKHKLMCLSPALRAAVPFLIPGKPWVVRSMLVVHSGFVSKHFHFGIPKFCWEFWLFHSYNVILAVYDTRSPRSYPLFGSALHVSFYPLVCWSYPSCVFRSASLSSHICYFG